jgi:hypothetical protein
MTKHHYPLNRVGEDTQRAGWNKNNTKRIEGGGHRRREQIGINNQ